MFGGKSSRPWAFADTASALRPHATAAGLTVLAAAPMLLLAVTVPPPLLLPVVSLISIAIAGIAASVAWWMRAERRGPAITSWDVSGAFALIACAAAILGDAENVLQLFRSGSEP